MPSDLTELTCLSVKLSTQTTKTTNIHYNEQFTNN